MLADCPTTRYQAKFEEPCLIVVLPLIPISEGGITNGSGYDVFVFKLCYLKGRSFINLHS